MIAIDRLKRPPAPMPWMERPTISTVIVGAVPDTKAPMMNTTMLSWKRRRRPSRSLNLPHSGVVAACASR